MHLRDADGVANSVDSDQEQSEMGSHSLYRAIHPNI